MYRPVLEATTLVCTHLYQQSIYVLACIGSNYIGVNSPVPTEYLCTGLYWKQLHRCELTCTNRVSMYRPVLEATTLVCTHLYQQSIYVPACIGSNYIGVYSPVPTEYLCTGLYWKQLHWCVLTCTNRVSMYRPVLEATTLVCTHLYQQSIYVPACIGSNYIGVYSPVSTEYLCTGLYWKQLHWCVLTCTNRVSNALIARASRSLII